MSFGPVVKVYIAFNTDYLVAIEGSIILQIIYQFRRRNVVLFDMRKTADLMFACRQSRAQR